MNVKKLLCAALVPVMLFTACSGGGQTADTDTSEAAKADIPPSEAVMAVLEEIPISSSVEKGTEDVETYYGDVDISELDSASFALCGSGSMPDEIAVLKFKTDKAAKAAEEGLQAKLDHQTELFKDYTPDEMYKLETAKVYSTGNYAVYLALADNERAKTIVDEKLKG